MNEKDKKNYGEQYQEMLEKQGYLFVNDPPAAETLTEKRYTYEDYLNWPEGERIELIDGQIHYMASPNTKHQRLKLLLCQRFSNYLHGKECEVFDAPFDVKIDFDIGEDSVVQPDILVICDKEKLDEKRLNGAPDLAIEILSPSTKSHDLVWKYNKYCEIGVREYWTVDPEKEEITVNILAEDKKLYHAEKYYKGNSIKVFILENLIINVTDLFVGYKGKEIVEIEQRVFEIAKRLLEMGLPIDSVAQGAGVSIEKVKELMENG